MSRKIVITTRLEFDRIRCANCGRVTATGLCGCFAADPRYPPFDWARPDSRWRFEYQ